MIQELQSAIVSRATSAGAFNTAIGGKFYFFQAPGGTTGKYAVLSDFAGSSSKNSVSNFEESFVQINNYHISNSGEDVGSPAGVHDLNTKCMALFDDCTISLTNGFSFIYCKRIAPPIVRKTEGGWVGVLQYQTLIEKGR
jgi:hypothetical protein